MLNALVSGSLQTAEKAGAVDDGNGGISAGDGTPEGIRPLLEVERLTIEVCDGNIPKATAHLGISASTIYRKRMAWQGEATS